MTIPKKRLMAGMPPMSRTTSLLPRHSIARRRVRARGQTARCELQVAVSRADERIPISHGRALFEAATSQKQFVELAGRHHDAFLVDSGRYFGEYRRFVREVGPRTAKSSR